MNLTSSDDSSPWQFSLRGMLIVSTAASFVAAIAAWRGPGSVVLSLGVLLTLANSLGWFRRWQSSRARPKWLGLGWLLFVVSLFLPAAEGCNRKPITGGELAWACVTVEFEAAGKVTSPGEERDTFLGVLRATPLKALSPHAFFVTITAANVSVLLAPLLWWAWRRDRANWVFGVVFAGAMLAWTLTWNRDSHGMLYGYYAWSLSFLWMLTAQRIPWSHQRIAWCVLAVWLYSGGFGPP